MLELDLVKKKLKLVLLLGSLAYVVPGYTFTPPPPRGACCLPDGTCKSLTQGQCGLQNGTYNGNNTSCESVTCNQPPNCSNAVASPETLWPPNHKFKNVEISGVTDPDGPAPQISITDVKQDEPTDGTGDGDTCGDADIPGDGTVNLRAERSGEENGRVYEVSFTATDVGGLSCQGSVNVCVPHDQSAESAACTDDGTSFDSETCL